MRLAFAAFCGLRITGVSHVQRAQVGFLRPSVVRETCARAARVHGLLARGLLDAGLALAIQDVIGFRATAAYVFTLFGTRRARGGHAHGFIGFVTIDTLACHRTGAGHAAIVAIGIFFNGFICIVTFATIGYGGAQGAARLLGASIGTSIGETRMAIVGRARECIATCLFMVPIVAIAAYGRGGAL